MKRLSIIFSSADTTVNIVFDVAEPSEIHIKLPSNVAIHSKMDKHGRTALPELSEGFTINTARASRTQDVPRSNRHDRKRKKAPARAKVVDENCQRN